MALSSTSVSDPSTAAEGLTSLVTYAQRIQGWTIGKPLRVCQWDAMPPTRSRELGANGLPREFRLPLATYHTCAYRLLPDMDRREELMSNQDWNRLE